MARVGLLGGTFNPIHLGHLLMAQEVQTAYGLDEVLFIPNQIPPHRRDERSLAPARDRYVMVCLATAGNPRFRASTVEIDRDEVSYTVNTVSRLREARPADSFTFITGADSLGKDTWFRLDDLLGMLEQFVAVARRGYPVQLLQERLATYGLANAARVAPLETPCMDISSTEIRRRVGTGQGISYMVPAAVEDYVLKMGLYR